MIMDQHPLADERSKRLAEEKAERAAHRKWLKETKPQRDMEKALRKRIYAARDAINNAAYEASEYLDDQFRADHPDVSWGDCPDHFLSMLESLVPVAQAAAAKQAGFESWQALKDAVLSESESD